MNAFLLATMLVGALVLPAHAQETRKVSVHGQTFILPGPQGACFLDERKDREYLDAVNQSLEPGALLISVFAPCNSLPRLRSGRADAGAGGQGVGMYMTLRNPAQASPGSPRKPFIDTLERKLGALSGSEMARQLEAARKRVEGSFGAEMGQPINLGVLGKDANALYYGAIADIRTGNKSEVVVNIGAMTVAKTIFMTLRIQDVYQGGRTIDALKQTVSRTANQFVLMNDP